jgi:hypothetical protein
MIELKNSPISPAGGGTQVKLKDFANWGGLTQPEFEDSSLSPLPARP